jgi:ferredoxin
MNKPLILFLIALAYSLAVWMSVTVYHFYSTVIFFSGAACILLVSIPALSMLYEIAILFMTWWIFTRTVPEDMLVWMLPLIGILLLTTSHASHSRIMRCTALAFVSTWMVLSLPALGTPLNWGRNIILISMGISIILVAVQTMSRPGVRSRSVDLIMCSYSGNTGHYAAHFIQGLKEAGSEVRVHRFHFHGTFSVDLNADALAIAYPTHGWNPPWPLLHYLVANLPRGHGKPAFLLYSAAGGPENAHMLAWIILTIKGWKVMGRTWAVYPMNVTTFRIGPKKMWRAMDIQNPAQSDLKFVRTCGHLFAQGYPAGLPFIVWPFFMVPIGLLFDNKWFNTFAYRNYPWKKRCTSCGICVAICPAQRLSLKNGYPKAKGTCTICLDCVNLCPVNAMHLAGWTEYGQQYHPLWPEYLVQGENSTPE